MIAKRLGPLLPVMIVFALHNTQTHMNRPYVPLFAASLDIGYLGVGIVAAAVGFLPIFFALPIGSLTDRVGVRPMVATGAAINVVGYLLLSLFPTLPIIIVTQMLAGFSNLLIALAIQSYIGTLGKGVDADRNFASFSVSTSVGQIAGPLLGGMLVALVGFPHNFWSAVVFSSVCFVVALFVLPKTTPTVARTKGRAVPGRAWHYLKQRQTQLAILASSLMAIPEILRTSFLPLYLDQVVHLNLGLVGYVLALFAVAGLVSKAVLPRITARFGRQVALFAVTLGCALAILAIPASASIWVVLVVVVCMGLTFGLGRPASMAMAAQAATPGEEGFVVALRLSGNRVTDFVLPVLFGSAATVFGIGAVFVAGSGLLLLGAGALVRPMLTEIRARGKGPPRDDEVGNGDGPGDADDDSGEEDAAPIVDPDA